MRLAKALIRLRALLEIPFHGCFRTFASHFDFAACEQQSRRPRSLISVFVICPWESIIVCYMDSFNILARFCFESYSAGNIEDRVSRDEALMHPNSCTYFYPERHASLCTSEL